MKPKENSNQNVNDATIQAINIVFDAGKFVEVETDDGKSINIGEWKRRSDGSWSLRITKLPNNKTKPKTQIDISKIRPGDMVKIIDHPPEEKNVGPLWTETMDFTCGKFLEVTEVTEMGRVSCSHTLPHSFDYNDVFLYMPEWISEHVPAKRNRKTIEPIPPVFYEEDEKDMIIDKLNEVIESLNKIITEKGKNS